MAAKVFPTCVGVFLEVEAQLFSPSGLPHVRGGVSRALCIPFSKASVFPTCVGVFLDTYAREFFSKSLPHVRGGVSQTELFLFPGKQSSPRAWGCFPRRLVRRGEGQVFPTCVGVFLVVSAIALI